MLFENLKFDITETIKLYIVSNCSGKKYGTARFNVVSNFEVWHHIETVQSHIL
jgi:hypothetical protein